MRSGASVTAPLSQAMLDARSGAFRNERVAMLTDQP